MIALAGTLASSAGHLHPANPLLIIAYVALTLMVCCFVAGVRKWRFPLAGGDGHASALTAPAPAALEPPVVPLLPFDLRYYARRSSLAGTLATSHYVGVTNLGGQPERRAHMTADRMDPYPRKKSAVGTDPLFPHTVPPKSGGTPDAGILIGPGQERSWLIGNTWTRPDGRISVYEFSSGTGADWELCPDECWRISYRIRCVGVPDQPFSIVIEAEEGQAVVSLEG
jgi:hypothetical protein